MELTPGDTIVMPERIRTGSFLRGIRDWSQVFSQFALGAAALRVVGRRAFMGMNLGSPAELASQISEGRWLIVADTLAPDLSSRASRSLYWLEFAALALERKRQIGFLILACLLVAFAVAMLLPNQYTAVTALLPPQQSRSTAAAVLGPFGDLASLVGRDGIRNPSAIFISLLESRSLADRLIARFDLRQAYGSKRDSQARKQLQERTAIENTKEGVIMIQVRDRDPRRAADRQRLCGRVDPFEPDACHRRGSPAARFFCDTGPRSSGKTSGSGRTIECNPESNRSGSAGCPS